MAGYFMAGYLLLAIYSVGDPAGFKRKALPVISPVLNSIASAAPVSAGICWQTDAARRNWHWLGADGLIAMTLGNY